MKKNFEFFLKLYQNYVKILLRANMQRGVDPDQYWYLLLCYLFIIGM